MAQQFIGSDGTYIDPQVLAAARLASNNAQRYRQDSRGLGGLLGSLAAKVGDVGKAVYGTIGGGVASFKDLLESGGANQNNLRAFTNSVYGTNDYKDAVAKQLGTSINAADTLTDFVPGMAIAKANPVGGALAGGISGLGNTLKYEGADFDWNDAGNSIASGAITGAVTAGFNKGLNNATKGIGKKIASNALTRGAASGAIGGAIGSGVSGALNGQDLGSILGNMASSATQGAVTGAAMAGVSQLGTKAKNAALGKFWGQTPDQVTGTLARVEQLRQADRADDGRINNSIPELQEQVETPTETKPTKTKYAAEGAVKRPVVEPEKYYKNIPLTKNEGADTWSDAQGNEYYEQTFFDRRGFPTTEMVPLDKYNVTFSAQARDGVKDWGYKDYDEDWTIQARTPEEARAKAEKMLESKVEHNIAYNHSIKDITKGTGDNSYFEDLQAEESAAMNPQYADAEDEWNQNNFAHDDEGRPITKTKYMNESVGKQPSVGSDDIQQLAADYKANKLSDSDVQDILEGYELTTGRNYEDMIQEFNKLTGKNTGNLMDRQDEIAARLQKALNSGKQAKAENLEKTLGNQTKNMTKAQIIADLIDTGGAAGYSQSQLKRMTKSQLLELADIQSSETVQPKTNPEADKLMELQQDAKHKYAVLQRIKDEGASGGPAYNSELRDWSKADKKYRDQLIKMVKASDKYDAATKKEMIADIKDPFEGYKDRALTRLANQLAKEASAEPSETVQPAENGNKPYKVDYAKFAKMHQLADDTAKRGDIEQARQMENDINKLYKDSSDWTQEEFETAIDALSKKYPDVNFANAVKSAEATPQAIATANGLKKLNDTQLVDTFATIENADEITSDDYVLMNQIADEAERRGDKVLARSMRGRADYVINRAPATNTDVAKPWEVNPLLLQDLNKLADQSYLLTDKGYHNAVTYLTNKYAGVTRDDINQYVGNVVENSQYRIPQDKLPTNADGWEHMLTNGVTNGRTLANKVAGFSNDDLKNIAEVYQRNGNARKTIDDMLTEANFIADRDIMQKRAALADAERTYRERAGSEPNGGYKEMLESTQERPVVEGPAYPEDRPGKRGGSGSGQGFSKGQKVTFEGAYGEPVEGTITRKLTDKEKQDRAHLANPDAGDYYEIEYGKGDSAGKTIKWKARIKPSKKEGKEVSVKDVQKLLQPPHGRYTRELAEVKYNPKKNIYETTATVHFKDGSPDEIENWHTLEGKDPNEEMSWFMDLEPTFEEEFAERMERVHGGNGYKEMLEPAKKRKVVEGPAYPDDIMNMKINRGEWGEPTGNEDYTEPTNERYSLNTDDDQGVKPRPDLYNEDIEVPDYTKPVDREGNTIKIEKRNWLQGAGERFSRAGDRIENQDIYNALYSKTADRAIREGTVDTLKRLGYGPQDYGEAAKVSTAVNQMVDNMVENSRAKINDPDLIDNLRNIANDDSVVLSPAQEKKLNQQIRAITENLGQGDMPYTYDAAKLLKESRRLISAGGKAITQSNYVNGQPQNTEKAEYGNQMIEMGRYLRQRAEEATNGLFDSKYTKEQVATMLKNAGANQETINYVADSNSLSDLIKKTSTFEQARQMDREMKTTPYRRNGVAGSASTNPVTRLINRSGVGEVADLALTPVGKLTGAATKGIGNLMTKAGNAYAVVDQYPGLSDQGATTVANAAARNASNLASQQSNDQYYFDQNPETAQAAAAQFEAQNGLGGMNTQLGTQNGLTSGMMASQGQQYQDPAKTQFVDTLNRLAAGMQNALNAGDLAAYEKIADIYSQYAKIYSAQAEINGWNATAEAEDEKLTANQQKALAAMQQLNQLASMQPDFGTAVSNVPILGNIVGMTGGNQYATQASALETTLVNLLSGTSATEAEREQIRRAYIPQFTDSDAVKQQKLQSAYQLIQNLYNSRNNWATQVDDYANGFFG
jgi:hypothetical protein